jgi:hypothetical protein
MAYEERYVAFADILGFTDNVRKTETNSHLQEALAKVLSEIGTREDRYDELMIDGFQYQAFSDSIVMSTKGDARGLSYLFSEIGDLARQLLSKGFLMRGAVAKGKLYHDRGAMFGPAFLDAYRIESTIAKFPRVVLSREVHQDLRQIDEDPFHNEVIRDEDGPPYLHVLRPFRRPSALTAEQLHFAQTCGEVIQNLLNDSIYEPKHYEKLRWLAIYWNTTIGSSLGPLQQIKLPEP